MAQIAGQFTQSRPSRRRETPLRAVGGAVVEGASDWYKDAIIYELHVRAFQDSDGDGIGDFQGLISRLDYLQDLGVTAIWLLPFYPSPLRDDGYDIADYGFLRDKRDEVIKNYPSTSVETILDTTQRNIETRERDNWFAVTMAGIPLLLLGLLAGCAVGDSRRIQNWAREKPAKHIKAKH